MKKVFFPVFALFFSATLLLTFNACVDKDFDQPPVDHGSDPEGVVANTTIAQLKALHNGFDITDITDDVIIKGIVTTNDEAGNFYKEIYLQDETGAIKIGLDFTDIYLDYQEGRRLFIKCQNLKIDEFSGIYSIGAALGDNGLLVRMPKVIADEHIFPGETNHHITPNVVSINEINGDVLGTLVTLEGVEFLNSEIGGTYADADGQVTLNRNLVDCNGSNIIMRNSGYSSFAGVALPTGNGTVTGIANQFFDDKQMFISDTDDVDMEGDRCDGGGGGTDLVSNTTVAQLKAMHNGSDITDITSDAIIEVVVTTSDQTGNFYKEIFVQDATGAIKIGLDFTDIYTSYQEGRKLFIKCQDLKIDEFSGIYSIGATVGDNDLLERMSQAVANQHIFPDELNHHITPAVVSINQIDGDILGTLVTLQDVQFIDGEVGGTYADADGPTTLNRNLTDCDGNTIIMRNSGYASFAADALPTGNGSVTGIASQFFDDKQMFISDTDDVSMTADRCDGGGGGGDDCIMDEDFSFGTLFDPINLTGWSNIPEEGSDLWKFGEYQGNAFATIQGYEADSPDLEAWLITSAIDNSTNQVLTFNSIIGHPVTGHEPLEVFISENFDGSNVAAATWTALSANIATAADITTGNFSPEIPSGEITLNTGTTVHIAFVYTGDDDTNTSTIQLDDVQVCEP